jgi:hypothetical protein
MNESKIPQKKSSLFKSPQKIPPPSREARRGMGA